MKCCKCGNEVKQGAKFCPECGSKIETEVVPKTAQLRCKACGGVMDKNNDRPVLFCPFCGSKELILESDDVTIQRIRANAYKEVEIERMHQQAEQERRRDAREEKQARAEEFHRFSKSILSKVLIVFFVIFLLITYSAFNNGRILPGLVAALQTGLCAAAWLIGMQYVKVKVQRLHILLAVIAFALIIPYSRFNGNSGSLSVHTYVPSPTITEDQETDEEKGIYTYQIRNYVGMNCASLGATDKYGQGKLTIRFITYDGQYLPETNEELMKQYVVIGQDIPEKTPITIVHQRDSKGEPYKSYVEYQSYEEILLYVSEIGDMTTATDSVIHILPTLDRHVYHIRNYEGRNAACCGSSTNKPSVDTYGVAKLEISFMCIDGDYIDSSDINSLRQYIVVGQDIPANDELQIIYDKDSRGEEYQSYITSQSYDKIVLMVKKLDDSIIAQMPEIPTEATTEPISSSSSSKTELAYNVLSNGCAEITGFQNESSTLRLSSEIDGHKITHIASSAFKNCTSLTSIVCFADLEEIGDYAFQGCTGLQKISIPSSTKLIGAHAFENCTGATSLVIWGGSAIGEYAFAGCSKLEKISVPSDIKAISAHAFENCSGASTVTIWGSESIGEYAFAGCSRISKLSLPSETKLVGAHAFDGCKSLEKLTVWNDNIQIDKTAFVNCPKLDSEYAYSEATHEAATKTTTEATVENTMATQSEEPQKPTESNSVSYSTNDKETVKNGNSGVYAYRNRGGSYSIYYIIDFDEGYVYYFTDGNGEESCDRIKIVSGTLNDVVIITYHSGSDTWNEGFHFKWARQPDHLVMEDYNHFEYDFYTTDLGAALTLRANKRIVDY